jgi:hypothetical protein
VPLYAADAEVRGLLLNRYLWIVQPLSVAIIQ